jgi:plastocyanin
MNKTIVTILIIILILIGSYFIIVGTNSSDSSTNTSNESPVNITFDNSSTSQNTSNIQQSTSTAVTQSPSEIVINIKNFAFSPSSITINKGTKVTWTNDDSAPHTVTSDSGKLLNSPTLSTGQSFSHTFTSVGTTTYHCTIHKMMKGEIIVKN